MTWISDPFVKFRCAGPCGRHIERKIGTHKTAQEISDLRDGPALYCAECHAGVTVVDDDGAVVAGKNGA